MRRSILPIAFGLLVTSVSGQTPGGVSSRLQLWLKAEGYTSGAANWTDNSGNARHATRNGTVPTTTQYNFQPVPTNLTSTNYFSVPHTDSLNAYNGAISVFAVGLAGPDDYGPFVAKTFNSAWDAGWVLATSSPTSDLGFTTQNWTGSGSTNVAKQSGVSTTIPYIASGFGDGATTNVVSVCDNGTAMSTNTSAKSTTTLALRVGADGYGYDFDGGSVAEVVVYNTYIAPGAARQRIWSYLAMKYGITLNNGGGGSAGDYLSSAAATVWNATTNAGYNSNVFGIARDDGSGLSQRQSVSINGGLQPVIANGTTLVSLNSGGTALGANQSFLIAGSDGGATTFTTLTTGLANVTHRLGRIWKVQETGTVGTVTVAWPDTETSIRLIVSNDATIDASDATVTTAAITINGVNYRQANVDLTNGQYFTFGVYFPGPGGVYSSLALWLTADQCGVAPGVDAADWDDLSKNANPVERVGARVLQAGDAAHNFQPFFTGFTTTDHFRDDNSSIAPSGSVQATEVTMFGMARINSTSNDGRIVGIDDTGTQAGDPSLSIDNARTRFHRTSSSNSTPSTATATLNRSSVFSAYTSGTTVGVGVDGVYNTAAITSGGGMMGNNLLVGYGTQTLNGVLPGDLQEVVWFKRTLTAAEIKKVETYLALKYGYTLGTNSNTTATYNYVNSADATVWSKTTNSGYNNDIAGIARDDGSLLNQKQSNSVNATGSVTMALGSTIAATNTANANTFSQDRSYLIWGHDGAAHNTVHNNASCFSNLPTGVQARILRKWKTQVTNFAQTVTLAFDQADVTGFTPISNLRLLVDNDGTDWTNATTYTASASVGGRIEFSGVSFSASQPFFTLATINYNSTPLPIELLSFEGETKGEVNHLTWATATETNNDRFEVERSADSETFEHIGTVDGAGNSLQTRHYELIDQWPMEGVNYYRLMQVDFDGTSTYSNVISLLNKRGSEACRVSTLDAEGLYALTCAVPEGAYLELFGAAGQPLERMRFSANGTQEVDLRSFASGIYFARVIDGENVKSYKLLRP